MQTNPVSGNQDNQIWELCDYVCSGKRITRHKQFVVLPDNYLSIQPDKYVGHIIVRLGLDTVPLDFEIGSADSLVTAFSLFDAFAEQAAKKFIGDVRSSKLTKP